MTRRNFVLLLLLSSIVMGVSRPRGMAEVRDLRFWSYPDYTRVVVELSRPVKTEVRHLAPDPLAKKSERLYLDLPGIWVGRDYQPGIPVGDGLLLAVRLGFEIFLQTRQPFEFVGPLLRSHIAAIGHVDRDHTHARDVGRAAHLP